MYEREEGEWSGDASFDALARKTSHYDDIDGAATVRQDYKAAPLQLRLVKLTSDVLPKTQSVAIIDADIDCTSIGRDRAFTPRIRLPAMEVSKHHANIFPVKRNGDRDITFAISDMGSTHGTYVYSSGATSARILQGDAQKILPAITSYSRLAAPKQASAPYTLDHLALLRISHTVFQVHLHATSWTTSCDACALKEDGSNEIPLTAKTATPTVESKVSTANVYTPSASSGDRKIDTERTRRQAMKELKTQHLAGPSRALGEAEAPRYVDRAAERRQRFGSASSHDVNRKAGQVQHQTRPMRTGPVANSAGPTERSESIPAAIDDASNRGYKMYAAMHGAKLGGEASSSPVMVIARGVEGRAGLGSKQLVSVDELASRERQAVTKGARSHPYDANESHARQRRRYEASLSSAQDP